MSDERLRELERRWKQSGAPSDWDAYLRESARAGQLWNLYSAQFDAALLRPWDAETIEMLVVMAHHLQSDPPSQRRQVIRGGVSESRYPDSVSLTNGSYPHFAESVVIGGSFGSNSFCNAQRILVLGGEFEPDAFSSARDCIVVNGIFARNSFTYARDCILLGGTFDAPLRESLSALVLGGTYNWTDAFSRCQKPTMLGGKFDVYEGEYLHGPFRSSTDVRYWNLSVLPNNRVIIPQNGYFVLRGSLVVGELPVLFVPNIYVYTDACIGVHPAGVRHLPPNTLYDILPLLRADKTVTRNNLRQWIDGHFARLTTLELPNCPYQA